MGKDAKFVVRLTLEERSELEGLVAIRRTAAEKSLRARVFLKADEGEAGPAWTDAQIAEALDISRSKIHRLRQRLVESGLETALVRQPSDKPRQLKLDGPKEARLVALACSQPPAGRARWTLQLLANQLVELSVVDDISDETVRRTLKKTNSNRGCVVSG